MSIEVPRYELKRVYDDGSQTTAEILPITEPPLDAIATRRGFLGAGVAASAVTLALQGQINAYAAVTSSGVMRAHEKSIRGLAISPDGTLLASCGLDRKIKLWQLAETEARKFTKRGALLQQFDAEGSTPAGVAFSHDGAVLAAGGSDRVVRLWNVETGGLHLAFSKHAATVTAIGAAPRDPWIISAASDGQIMIFAAEDGGLRGTAMGDTQSVLSLACDAEGKRLLSGSKDGRIRLWSLPTGALEQTLEGHVGGVTRLGVTADGRRLISRSTDRTLKVWSLPEGNLLRTLEGPWANVTEFALSPDGKLIITVTGRNIDLWSMPGAKPVANLRGHLDEVVSLAVTPDSRRLVSGDRSGVVRIWDLTTHAELGLLAEADASPVDARGTAVNVTDIVTGRTITYTLPCGSPIPPGAVCTCNCVPGTLAIVPPPTTITKTTPVPVPREPRIRPEPIPREPKEPRMSASQRRAEERLMKGLGAPYSGPYYPGPSYGGGTTCTCNKVCVCIPVCQASHLLSADLVLARMAEFVLRHMARDQGAYLQWAASQATPRLRQKIVELRERTCLEPLTTAATNQLPFTGKDALRRLERADEVVRIIAAQALTLAGLTRSQAPPGNALPQGSVSFVAEQLTAAYERPWQLRYGVSA